MRNKSSLLKAFSGVLFLIVFMVATQGLCHESEGLQASEGNYDPGFSNTHFPMILVNADETSAHFNVLVPRNKNYELRARLTGVRRAPAITGVIQEKGIQDHARLLQESVMKVSFKGLAPHTMYDLELVEVSRFGDAVVDRRSFSTFDQTPQTLKFVTGSCMSDEIAYEEARLKISTQLLAQRPDVIILSGDEVYVDAFDFVDRHRVTDGDVWMRYFRSFQVNPLFRAHHLVPILATWDDHDTGIDNGNRHTPTIGEARRAFLALFGDVVPTEETAGKGAGVYRMVSLRGQNFILLDNRSFRGNPDPIDRYGHLGQAQEEWMLEQMRTTPGFFWLVDGGLWGAEAKIETHADGFVKRLTEGFHGDHPAQYAAVMDKIHELKVHYAMISGDIHASQIVEHHPRFAGTPRYSPFPTLEITSSAMFSFMFPYTPGQPDQWPDPQRMMGVRKLNFIVISSEAIDGGVDLEITSIGKDGEKYFNLGTRLRAKEPYQSLRRKILAHKSSIPSENGLVKVAFFDVDSTMSIPIKGRITANGPRDVMIVPGAANKIAEFGRRGFFRAAVSNRRGIFLKEITFEGGSNYDEKFASTDKAIRYTFKLLHSENPDARFEYYDFAERQQGDYFTKPNGGMARHLERLLAEQGLAIDWENSVMIGDSLFTSEEIDPRGVRGDGFSNADRGFAVGLGIPYRHPANEFGWTAAERKVIVEPNAVELRKLLECRKGLGG